MEGESGRERGPESRAKAKGRRQPADLTESDPRAPRIWPKRNEPPKKAKAG